ncbi:sentrin-specific protease 7 isoform X2 [Betta splendens]|uniref:Sentrin-specific protease 7 isoform X2 n=1 Tax=Betta splendens TaxID=158456 RepID=A0A6P7LGI4_BETSP|nr:sentrin-specific protease 7 isoform X2 [Betta splendens]
MMERRRALILPFTVDKDKLMENPLIIPKACISPECGKLERQVSWTAIAGCKVKQNDTPPKKRSVLLGHNGATVVTLEMARRKPCLILTDVLKTEQGKTYLERIKLRQTPTNRRRVTSTRRESGRPKEEPLISREMRSKNDLEHSEPKNDPKHNQKTTPLPSPRRTRKKLQMVDDADKEEIETITVGKESEEDSKVAEVVDCGLSVSWEHAEDIKGCEVVPSPETIDSAKDVQHNLKRKRKDSDVQCNGTGSPKRNRGSVLRLSGEGGRNEGAFPAHVCVEDGDGNDGGDNRYLENGDRSIVQFTVGEDARTEIVIPMISQTLEAGDNTSSPRRSLSHKQDSTTNTSPPEPIVLSSDDEESGAIPEYCSSEVHTLTLTLEDTELQGQASRECVAEQPEATDMQDMKVLHIVIHDLPASPAPIDSDYFMGIAFSSLHCGAYRGKAKGQIMIGDEKISIPLKDITGCAEGTLSFARKELRRYSVWEQEEMEAQQLHFRGDEEPSPAAILLLYVSENAAATIQQDLYKLCTNQDEPIHTGKASPFILLSLKDPLEGMEGALFRSLLDIDCLNSASPEPFIPHLNHWGDVSNPVLSLDESIDLIRRTGLDTSLLSLLGLDVCDPGHNKDQEEPNVFEMDKIDIAQTEIEIEPHEATAPELEIAPQPDTIAKLDPDEDETEEEQEHPSEKKKEEPTNVYTLCHRRTKGCYHVSLCKPGSNWTKFKHQGLTRRLIQFPPPPLKGGITVTMEDLQCLDSGQFLNDVIIDFYLKYLLQNASAAVAKRSHIFSSFFYKQLTRRDNASEGTTSDSCQRQRRHQRVKTWTRHVDIFDKDFLFVPVNQEAHWYLVVICFPGLTEPKVEAWTSPDSQGEKCDGGAGGLADQDEAHGSKSPSGNSEMQISLDHSDGMDTQTENPLEESSKDPPPGQVNCTEKTCQRKAVCKRPCILIMDSLKLSLHERVVKLLWEYLQSEWEVRRGSSREFGPDQMRSSHCLVPLQDNTSDCGLYLLQYVESFLEDPVVHFDLPLHLERWFPRQKVRRKRDKIRDLVLNLYRHQNLHEDE